MHHIRTQISTLLKTVFIMTAIHWTVLAEAKEAYFTPTVSNEVVQFGSSPVYIRDAVIRVVLSGPDDYWAEKTYYAGEDIIWVVNRTGGQTMPDGTYDYEITQSHRSSSRELTSIDLEGRTSNVNRENGTLSVVSGRWVSPEVEESSVDRDQTINDDLVVLGSACIGTDCSNNESFDFDAIRLKENNLRIRFVDTSNSASFPSTDWELRANDTTNGGANKFSIADFTNNREIFTLEGAAPANSLFVDDRGRVGFGTSAPLLDQHILSGNTPAIRFEQDGSGGFASQTWDIGGNEAEFFIRDSNNASVPVRVLPGAPSDSLVVNSAGDIEIGGTIITNPVINLPTQKLSQAGQRQLAELSEVEQYINRYQQLPGLNPEAEDLVLLQMQLLEKIQELTLHAIKQDKRIQELEAKLKK